MTIRLATVFLAIAVAVPICGAQVKVSPESSPAGLLAALKSKDASTRRDAANRLGALRARDAVKRLAELLTDRESPCREAAAFALGQIADRGVTGLVIPLLADKDSEVRSTAAFALGMLGDRKALDALSFALGDPEPEVRSSAVVAMGLMQDEEGIDEITELLEDPSLDVRYDAAWALGQIGEPESEEHLRAALVTVDMLKTSDAAREAFKQCVQNSIEDLRTETHKSATDQAARPRRVTGVIAENRYDKQSRSVTIRQSVKAAPTERANNANSFGTVRLRVLVAANGRAARAYVVDRRGYGLDQRAVEAILQYKFDPALQAGLPQTTWIDLEVKF
ncbi:MAG TPA: TonB family protein [Blastocatellia bacterium]|nr:TonB family protein [Blastocatellia bacterium]